MLSLYVLFFFFNDTATTEIYTLSLHDALPIYGGRAGTAVSAIHRARHHVQESAPLGLRLCRGLPRSEEHTSELQSRQYLVCRLLLEKKKKRIMPNIQMTMIPNTNQSTESYIQL